MEKEVVVSPTLEYQYQALDSAERQIRVLHLYPGDSSDRVLGELVTVSLNDKPIYDALSYVWGSPEPRHQLDLLFQGHKQHIYIGPNLQNALKCIGYQDKKMVIWTDAICINQNDKSEVGQQVQMMGHIYSQAKTVRAWMNHETNAEAEVFQLLPDIEDLGDLHHHDQSFWSPAVDLLQNKYWTRVWIQQELILAQEVIIHCQKTILSTSLTKKLLSLPAMFDETARTGSSSETIDKISHAINGSREPFYGGLPRARRSIAHRQATQPSFRNGTFSNDFSWGCLLDLFNATTQLETSVGRDRVYALLGIALDVEEGDIVVDYTLPDVAVYAQVAEMFVKKHKSLAFLCHRNTKVDDSLPTWLPAPEKGATVRWLNLRASAEYMKDEAYGALVHSNGLALSAYGVCVDRIDWTSGTQPLGDVGILEWKTELQNHLQSMQSTVHTTPLIDLDDVVNALYPWWKADREYSGFGLSKGQFHEKRQALAKLFDIAERYMDDLTLRNIKGQEVDLSNLATAQEMEAFRAIFLAVTMKVFVGTKDSRIGLISNLSAVESGDEVWALFGCPLPIVLRPRQNTQHDFTWVGCIENMPGIMKGEVFEGYTGTAKPGDRVNGREVRQVHIW